MTRLLPHERRKTIYERVKEKSNIPLVELAQAFGVSEMTIRRDVKELEAEGALRVSYGHVTLGETNIWELPVAPRLKLNVEEKQKIARVARAMIQPGEAVAFDASTSSLEVARLVDDIDELTVVTNSIPLANLLASKEGINIIVSGGAIRHKALSLIGPLAVQTIAQFNINKFFLSALGLDRVKGLTETNLAEIEVKKAFIAHTEEVIVLADHTKLGKVAMVTICLPSEIDILITDDGADPAIIDIFSEMGIRVIVAD